MKKYYCENCGEEISQEEYEMYDGLCEECAWEEEDDDLFLGGGW
jgi:NMD protein affecting ribosome stability and mRNA decay